MKRSVLAILLLILQAQVPMGAISVNGHLRDSSGSPVAGVPVQLVRFTYNVVGQRTLQSYGMARTDDQGEYRIRDVIPGRYYILAGAGPGSIYFPGGTEPERAALLEIRSGSELNSMDFALPRQNLRQVRGRIIDSTTGRPPASASIGMSYETLGGSGSVGSGQSYNAVTGAFEFRNVVPGSYVVQATAQGPDIVADDRGRIAVGAARPIASAVLDISGADIENVLLTLALPVSIRGRITVDASGPVTLLNLDRIRVQLSPSKSGIPVTGMFSMPQVQFPNSDGWFNVDGMVPGEYVVSLAGLLPPDCYLKSAWLGSHDVLNQPMQFSSASGGILDIVIGTKATRLDGRVIDNGLKPVSGAIAVLIPDSNKGRFDLYKSAVAGANGEFSFRGVSPGDYKVFSWETLEPYEFYDPGFLRLFENRGKRVRLAESSTEHIDVPLISAEGLK